MMNPDPRPRRALVVLAVAVAVAAVLAAPPASAVAQAPAPEEERLKILTDPDEVKKKVEKDKNRPPLELFRSQVAPFDILPYVKANHWSTMSLELRANYEDYAGELRTSPIRLLGLPQEMTYVRDAALVKTQRSRLGLQILLPRIPKDITLELNRPDAIRADEVWQANLRVLEPHQMLILVLSKETNDAYALWNRYQALYPENADRGDLQALDRQRYYRLVLPLEPDRPPVSPHPLAWTPISHVYWDQMPADNLNPAQQQAMLDWIHWGGQLVLNGGAGAPYNVLKDSFLGEHLPADAAGENASLDGEALRPLSEAYRPLVPPRGADPDIDGPPIQTEAISRDGTNYLPPAPIRPAANRPVYLNGLVPRDGSVPIPLGDAGGRAVGVERRVGRGRILMLAVDLNDPAIATWPGLDTFIRRVVLRRPEENRPGRGGRAAVGVGPRYGPLAGPDLSWFRILTRDLNVPEIGRKTAQPEQPEVVKAIRGRPRLPGESAIEDATVLSPETAVAEWFDDASIPRYCVRRLEEASGIKIPGSGFVLKVILAYIALLVPINWLVCRYALGRRELAWVIAPILALGFAIGVERLAAYDVGYNSATDEIDVVEIQGGYPRAHVSRFLSLYSTGRTRFNVSYPNEPTSLALPLDNGRSLRGEDVGSATWRSYPTPGLEGLLVQPRSLAFVRAEQMINLDGAVRLGTEGTGRTVVNGGGLELRDAVVIEDGGDAGSKMTRLGTIPPGATVPLAEPADGPASAPPADLSRDFDPGELMTILANDRDRRPENAGSIRLVAWTPGTVPGQAIEPALDRRRGFTAVVVHLSAGATPSPSGPAYDLFARPPAPPPTRPASQPFVPPRAVPGGVDRRGSPTVESDPIQRVIRDAREKRGRGETPET